MPAICDFGATLTQYLLRPVDAALPRTEDARASTLMARCGFSQTVAGTIKKVPAFFLPALKETRYGYVQRWTCSKMAGKRWRGWRATVDATSRRRRKWDFLICFGGGLTPRQRIGRDRTYQSRRNPPASSCAITAGKSWPTSITKMSLRADWRQSYPQKPRRGLLPRTSRSCRGW